MAKERNEGWDNPHPLWSDEWYAWKEQHFDYRPYHMGTSPGGKPCPTNPRVARHGEDHFKCPACYKIFPTSTSITGPLPYSEES